MSFYWVKTNFLIKKIFSKYIWDMPPIGKTIYLTFDDGPTPEVTEWVLEELKKHQAKATFFCIGNNIKNNPNIISKIISDGHTFGNHTFNHLNGWKTSTDLYLKNVSLCENLLPLTKTKLFRPPYGKIKSSQANELIKMGYKIIMWDVLSADFDPSITKEKCLKNVISNIAPGSIIIFHDSVKAFKNLEYTLPKVLKYWKEKGFVFEVIR